MAEAFDPKAFLRDTPSPPISASNFDPKSFLAEPSVPISGPRPGEAPPPVPEDTRSDTERRLTAERLKRMMDVKGGGGFGGMTERMTDWLVPGSKNVMSGLVGLLGNEGTLGEKWGAGVNAQKEFTHYNRKATAGPLGYGADVLGAIGSLGRPGGNAGSLNPSTVSGPTVTATERTAQTLPGAVKTGAVQGAVSGAAENSQDLPSAIQGGVKGGVTGGVVGAGSHTLTGLIGRLADNRLNAGAAAERAGQRGPTSAEYYDQAGTMFRELDNAGIQFDRGQARRLGGLLPQVLRDANYTATSAPELADALRTVYSVGARGAPPLTFTELQAVRGQVSAAAQANPQNANLRRIAGRVTGMIDEFIDNNVPNINRTGADLATLYPEARRLWRTGILGDTITDIEQIAANKAAVGSTGADDLGRRALAQQANKDIRSGLPTLPPAAEAARQAAIDGTFKQRAADTVATGSKNWQINAATGAGLGSAVGTATGLPIGITGPIAGLMGAAAGKGINSAAKGIANREAQNNMDTLVRSIMTGSADRPQSWEMPRDLLASLLARRGVQSGAVQASIPGGEYVIDELTKNR